MPDRPLSLQAIKEAARRTPGDWLAEAIFCIHAREALPRLVAALEVAREALSEVAHDRDGMGNPISTAAAALARMEAKILFDHEEVK